jgi:hypothetical protein
MELDSSIPIDDGEILHARQSVNGSMSAEGTSPPLTRIVEREGLPAPVLHEPLRACEPSVLVSSLIPTSDFELVDANGLRVYVSVADAFWADGHLEPGTLTARQRLPRCGGIGPETHVTVAPASPPDAPILLPFCPDARRLIVKGLKQGGVLTLWVQPYGGGTLTELGSIGIAHSMAQVDLPHIVGGSGPLMRIVGRQVLCELESPEGSALEFARSGFVPPRQPRIIEPLHDCLRAVPGDDLYVGSLTQVWSIDRGMPMSDLAIVPSPKARIPIWFPLVEGEKVELRQFGCGAPSPSDAVQVQPTPVALPAPEVVAPVRPGTQMVTLKGVLPGAHASLLVDWQERAATTETWEGNAQLWLATPLQEGDRLRGVQRLCSSSSPIEGDFVVVTKGRLAVEPVPDSAPGGVQLIMTVRSRDSETGEEIHGLPVMLGGTQVGISGTAFAWSAPTSGSSVAGEVKGGIGFYDASFSIALRQAIVVQLTAWPLSVLANRIVARDVTWTIRPHWAINSIHATGASTTAMVPLPPGSAGKVDIQLAFNVDAAGDIDGYVFEPHTFQVSALAATVELSKPSHAFSFQLIHRIIAGEDPDEGQLSIWVKYFGGN